MHKNVITYAFEHPWYRYIGWRKIGAFSLLILSFVSFFFYFCETIINLFPAILFVVRRSSSSPYGLQFSVACRCGGNFILYPTCRRLASTFFNRVSSLSCLFLPLKRNEMELRYHLSAPPSSYGFAFLWHPSFLLFHPVFFLLYPSILFCIFFIPLYNYYILYSRMI